MSNRKDLLRNLGIPEYPWSSDDDDPPTDSRSPSNSQPRSSGQQATPSSSTPIGTPGRATVPARDLYLSIINRSGRSVPVTASPITGTNRYFRSDLPLYLSRTTHTPAPELRERSGARDDSDIQRVLAFKRLTRNINNGIGRYSRCSGYSIPRIPSVSIPGAGEPSDLGNVSMRLPNWRASRTSATNNTPRSARNVANLPPSGREGGTSSRRRRTHSMEVHNSEDEPDELVSSSHAPVAAAPPLPIDADEPPIGLDTETDNPASSNNTSGASLEEDVVEIVDTPPTVDLDLIELPGSIIPSSSDPNLASTSRADEVDAPDSETQQSQGVKRKRRASSEDKPADPFTVKEFNQSLLRLLECPVCLEWMEPPMSQCRRGHLVCNRCRARLASCPVCRTTFSSVRNRAMEGVAEMLRYPCRHGCGREVRLRRRAPHEASCPSRKYLCPAPLCADKQPLPREQLATHFHSKHLHLVKLGCRHRFGLKVNSEAHDNWLVMALDEFFHVKVDVDIRTWGVIVYVAYIGPQCNAKDFAYEVTIDGQHNGRKMVYRRATHSDLESSSLNVSRQDCFHLTLDQALNFIRFKNRHCDAERFLEFDVELSKVEPPPSRDDSDS